MDKNINRDEFSSRWGFILACVGSAVGMGNIWMFPIRVHQFGGVAFLIPYFIFVIAIGYIGVVTEMSFGRAFKTGPLGAFEGASKISNKKFIKPLGIIPVLGSLGIAIGYSVVVAWIIKFLAGSLTGSVVNSADSGAYFGTIAGPFGSLIWHVICMLLCFIIMFAGVSNGIEKVNKFMMPAFFVLFIILAIRVATIPSAVEGYKFLFYADFSQLKNPNTWIYALGQSFFSLSLAGSGTVVYGSYLSNKENAPYSAKFTAVFDTIAAMLAALVIIPAIYAFNVETTGGPPLLFITMPEIFKNMPAGRLFSIIFFLAVLFAGISSLINLYETPVEMLEAKFNLSRKTSTAIILVLGFIIGIFIEDANKLGSWMDVISIYIIPLGALLAAIAFSWVCGKDFLLNEVSKGRVKRVEDSFFYLHKYVYCGVTLIIYLLGLFFGAIG